jgi:hypothetical protein
MQYCLRRCVCFRSTKMTTEAATTMLLTVSTRTVMIWSHFPEGIYDTAGLYLHVLVCVMLDARNACILNVKVQQEDGG